MLDYLVPLASEVGRGVSAAMGSSAQLRKLREFGGEVPTLLADAFAATLGQNLTAAEQHYVTEIERLRAQLEADTSVLEVQDFGAGNGRKSTSPAGQRRGHTQRIEVGKYCRDTSRRPVSGVLLLKLLRALRPTTVLELGTSVGISAAYQAAALTINGTGTLYTLEGATSVAKIARNNLQKLHLEQYAHVIEGRFAETLEPTLGQIGPVDFAFIDGHHDYAATLRYFEQIKSELRIPAVVMLDDISWSQGMALAWRKIASDSRVGLILDLYSIGLCVLDNSAEKRVLRLALPRT